MAKQELKLKVTQEVEKSPLQQLQAQLKALGTEQQKLFQNGQQTSKAFQDNVKKINALKNSIKELQGVSKGFAGKSPLSGAQLLETGENLTVVAAGLKVALSSMTRNVGDFITEANKLQSANLGLESLAKFKGIDPKAVQSSIQNLKLVQDGLITVGDASLALKNLLASGFNLQESINLIKGFGDSAAFGRQNALEFGYAITSATEGIKNQNSILVDNAGVTKNLSVILKEAGYSEKQLQNVQTDAGVRRALYNGILKETLAFTGDANKLTTTFQGKQQKLGQQVTVLKQEFGTLIQSGLTPFIDYITDSNKSTQILAGGMFALGGAFTDIIPLIAAVRLGLGGLFPAAVVTAAGTVAIGVSAVATGIGLMYTNLKYAIDLWNSGGGFIDFLTTGAFNKSDKVGSGEDVKIRSLDEKVKEVEDLAKSLSRDVPEIKITSDQVDKKKKLGGGTTPKTAKEITNEIIDLTDQIDNLKASLNITDAGTTLFAKYTEEIAELERQIKFLQTPLSELIKITSGVGTVNSGKPTEGGGGFGQIPIDEILNFNIQRKAQEEARKNQEEYLQNLETTFRFGLSESQNISEILGTTEMSKMLDDLQTGVSLASSIFNLISLASGGTGGGFLGILGGLFGGGGGASAAGLLSSTSVGRSTVLNINVSGETRTRGTDIVTSYRRTVNADTKLLKSI